MSDENSDSYKDEKLLNDSFSDDPATNPAKAPKKKEIDPAKNPDEQDSLSESSDKDKSFSGKKSDSGEENEEDKKRNEVRVEFTIEFEKKLAKYIPQKIQFEGDLRKKTLITTKVLDDKYSSDLLLFQNYIIYTSSGQLKILNKNLKLVFSAKIIEEDKHEIFGLKTINDETLSLVASDKARIIHLNVEKEDAISYEIIQEMTLTDFYCISEVLNNGYLLLAGGDRKYHFYDLEKPGQKITKENQYKLIGSVEKVHNVYDDDFPDVIDLNNGRIFSWLNDDGNIKVIEYYPNQKIIMSKNGITLHDAGLISDKYIMLMGLLYPEYDSWLMDTETLQIVKHWVTPQNDSFEISFKENQFFYSSTSRIALDEFIVKDGEFIRKNIYECYYNKEKKESYEERFSNRHVLDEYTFITKSWEGKVMIYKCSK